MTRYLMVAIACVCARALAAQTPDTSGASVTMSVTPQEIATNGTVTASGLAYPQPGGKISMPSTLCPLSDFQV